MESFLKQVYRISTFLTIKYKKLKGLLKIKALKNNTAYNLFLESVKEILPNFLHVVHFCYLSVYAANHINKPCIHLKQTLYR